MRAKEAVRGFENRLNTPDMPLPRSDEWRVHELRATAFFPGDSSQHSFPEWSDVFEEPPDTISTQPKSSTKEEVGSYRDGKVIYRCQPDRIEWRFLSSIEFQGDEYQLRLGPGARPFGESTEWFQPAMYRWATRIPVLSRLAFGAELLLPVNSPKEGYELLDVFLPDVRVDTRSRDFTYGINRRRNSESSGEEVLINRLSRWSLKRFGAKIQPTTGTQVIEGPELYMVNVELDINTVAEVETLPVGDAAGDLFDELVTLATEIATEGDRP